MGSSNSLPQDLPFGNNWKTVVLGWGHALAVDTDNSLWAWGSNQNGAVGAHLGTYCTISETQNNECGGWDYFTGLYFKVVDSPVMLLPNVVAMAAGQDFSLALKTDGTVWAWGDGGEGQLGNGYNYDSDKPSKVMSINLNK